MLRDWVPLESKDGDRVMKVGLNCINAIREKTFQCLSSLGDTVTHFNCNQDNSPFQALLEVWEYRVAWESVSREQVMQNHENSRWPCSGVEQGQYVFLKALSGLFFQSVKPKLHYMKNIYQCRKRQMLGTQWKSFFIWW